MENSALATATNKKTSKYCGCWMKKIMRGTKRSQFPLKWNKNSYMRAQHIRLKNHPLLLYLFLPWWVYRHHHSLKIRGQIKERDVVVLIDSGASHNFIMFALVKELGLPVASTKDFAVVLGTGAEIRATRVCWQVTVYILQN